MISIFAKLCKDTISKDAQVTFNAHKWNIECKKETKRHWGPFEILLWVVTQVPILHPILFNIFTNNLSNTWGNQTYFCSVWSTIQRLWVNNVGHQSKVCRKGEKHIIKNMLFYVENATAT